MATPARVERRPWVGQVRTLTRRPIALAAVIVLVIATVLVVRGSKHGGDTVRIMTAPVERRSIALSIEATGTVEPIDLIEVKSKASGQIVRMPVQVGSFVQKGALLAQIDPRDVQNQYDQALAALQAAEAKGLISLAQRKRSDELYAKQVITADEHETATLDYVNAQAAIVKARTDLDIAKQRRDDATVRAPITGTILQQPVSNGQVISSATSSVSGGTTLLKMADLGKVRMRAMVGETDIGNVRTGQAATVTVDAFPQRTFQGRVEKIEPQAVVEQSVTNFPVLVSVSNESGVLLPGMNGEVTMLVDERNDVPAIPVDAVRSVRELPIVAQALGLDPAKVKAQVDEQMKAPSDSMRARRRAMRAGGAGAAGSGRANRVQIAFVKNERGLEPRVVRLGLSDFDYAQVLDGLEEGEQVVLLGVAEAQANRAQTQSRIRERMGSGVPGVPGAGGSGRGGGGGR
jgi:HlyD family secretion protein